MGKLLRYKPCILLVLISGMLFRRHRVLKRKILNKP